MGTEVEQVSNYFNQLKAGDDFSFAAEKLRDLQKSDYENWKCNVAEFNKNVDMRSLGFEEDFSILGVNDQGKVVTQSEDGQTIQLRDRTHLEVQAERPNMASSEQWGNRQFVENPEGSATYTVRKRDNLWSIAKDTLTQQLGRTPKNAEITTAIKDIARENDINNPEMIYPGDKLTIPMNRPYENLPPRRSPSLAPDSENLDPDGNSRNPLGAPGLGSDGPGDTDDLVSERKVVNRDHADGLTTTWYEGELNDGFLGFNNTEFHSHRTTGRHGELLNSLVEYEGSGASITFADENGGNREIDHVKSIETDFNSEAGKYETTIIDSSGSKWRSVTDPDGTIVSFRQIPAADLSQSPLPLF